LIYELLLIGQTLPAVDLRSLTKTAPKEIAAFIERRAYCNHFLGEEPYDAERAAELDKTLRELRCNSIERDERKVRRSYRKRPALIRLLDETADALP
jgi:hypothetical protein